MCTRAQTKSTTEWRAGSGRWCSGGTYKKNSAEPERTWLAGSRLSQTRLIQARCAEKAADGNKSTDIIRGQRGTHSGCDCGAAESLNHSLDDRVSCFRVKTQPLVSLYCKKEVLPSLSRKWAVRFPCVHRNWQDLEWRSWALCDVMRTISRMLLPSFSQHPCWTVGSASLGQPCFCFLPSLSKVLLSLSCSRKPSLLKQAANSGLNVRSHNG